MYHDRARDHRPERPEHFDELPDQGITTIGCCGKTWKMLHVKYHEPLSSIFHSSIAILGYWVTGAANKTWGDSTGLRADALSPILWQDLGYTTAIRLEVSDMCLFTFYIPPFSTDHDASWFGGLSPPTSDIYIYTYIYTYIEDATDMGRSPRPRSSASLTMTWFLGGSSRLVAVWEPWLIMVDTC